MKQTAKTEFVLAFKGVSETNESAFISQQECYGDVRRLLSRKYLVGETHKSHPSFPMWLVSCYDNGRRKLHTGCDGYISKVLLVKVPRAALRSKTVWATQLKGRTIEDLARAATGAETEEALVTPELEVLEEVKLSRYKSVHTAMKACEKKYGLPRATLEMALTVAVENSMKENV